MKEYAGLIRSPIWAGALALMIGLGCSTAGPPTSERPDLVEAPILMSILARESGSSVAPRASEANARSVHQSLDFARTVLTHEAGRKLNAAQREGVARALTLAEEAHGLPVVLSLAIIRQESRFNPSARGPAGSIGLMQLKPSTAREIAGRYHFGWKQGRTLLDPEKNVRLGLAYLAQMRRKFGTTDHALAAYNIGPARLRRLLARGPLERGPYLTKIYAHVEALSQKYGE